MLIMPSVMAASLPPQKQYDSVIIWQSCDNSTYSNVTSIKNGPTTMIMGPESMIEISNDYYEYSFTNTSVLGTYIVNGYCDEDGTLTSWAYDFQVTPDGQETIAGTVFFIILIIFSITLLIISFVFHNYIFSFISGLLFMVTGVYSMIYGFTTFLSSYTRMISFIIIGLGMMITVASSIDLVNELSPGGDRKDDDD